MTQTPGESVLDTRGLLCPLPVIRTQERVRTLADGTELTVLASDPGTMEDIPAWCRVHGHTLLSKARDGRLCTFRLRIGKRQAASAP
ncbi:MAG: sulfurtransferase TusA family protein [Pseudomonadales bacterium]|nr:sulfurtransferase TusA family protein [Pseudomonadales bacterium]